MTQKSVAKRKPTSGRVGDGTVKRGQVATRDVNGLIATEARFVELYMMNGFKGGEAVREMNPKCKWPNQTAQNFLQRDHVLAEVNRQRALSRAASRKTLDDVIAEQERIAFANIDDFMTVGDDGMPRIDFSKVNALPDDERREKLAAIAEIGTDAIGDMIVKARFKMHSKAQALEALRLQLGGPGGGSGGTVVNVAVQVIVDPNEAAKAYQKLLDGGS